MQRDRDRKRISFALVLPAVYLLVALGAWIDFARLPPDGLANLGLMLVVLPVALLDLALRPADSPGSSVLIPDGWGYYADHAIFFAISVAVLASVLFLLGRFIDAWRRGKRA